MIKRIIEINSVPVVQVMPRAEVCRWQEVALAVLDGPPHLHGVCTWLAGQYFGAVKSVRSQVGICLGRKGKPEGNRGPTTGWSATLPWLSLTSLEPLQETSYCGRSDTEVPTGDEHRTVGTGQPRSLDNK